MIQSSSALKGGKMTKNFDAKQVAQQIIDSHNDMMVAFKEDYNNDHHHLVSEDNEGRNLQLDLDGSLCAAFGEILTAIATKGIRTRLKRMCPLALRSDDNSCSLDQVDKRISLVCNNIFSVADNLLTSLTGEEFVCASLCTTYYAVTCQGCD